MIAGFTYKNLDTSTILEDNPLCLASYDGAATSGSMSRSMLEGETTLTRRFSNEYGTMYEPLSFTYSLFKMDGEKFTAIEQRKIEAWLTSPKLSNKLVFHDCKNNSYLYYGYFSNTDWSMDGFALTFTFESKYPYALEEVQETIYDYTTSDSTTLTVNVPSEEYEEYIYPTIIAKGSPSSFTFTNVSDGNRTLTIETLQSIYVVVDCQYCRMYTATNYGESGNEVTQLNFGDVGQDGIDNFYFPRLLVGDNTIKVTGDVKIMLQYYLPVKKVGGWLV